MSLLDLLTAPGVGRYYQYDAMNRQTVVDAIDAAGTLGAEGHRLAYDLNGNRASDTHNGVRIVHWTGQGEVQAGETTEAYTYDALNRLVRTARDGVVVDTRGYDAASQTIVGGAQVTLLDQRANRHALQCTDSAHALELA